MSFIRKQGNIITVAILLAVIFVALGLAYGNPYWTELNKTIGGTLYNFLGDNWIPFFMVITNIGSGHFSLPLTGFLILYLVIRKKYWIALLLAYNLFGVRLLNRLLKSIFEIERPELEHLVHASNYSFPSGHTMNSTAFFGLLVFLLSRYFTRTTIQAFMVWATGLVLIFLIGLSRVYLGVHFPMDVLGGFAAGGTWLLGSIFVYNLLPIRERDTYRARSN